MSELHAAIVGPRKERAVAGASHANRWLFIDGASAFGGHEVMLLRWLEELANERVVNGILLVRAGSELAREGARHATVLELPRQRAFSSLSRRERGRGEGRREAPRKDARTARPLTLALSLRERVLGTLRDAVALARAIFTVRPHLCVIAEGCLLAQPLFVLLARLLRQRVVIYVPLVQTSASMGFGSARLRDRVVRALYANAPHAWVTLTREQAQDFRAWAGVRRPILVLPNTVSSAIEHRGKLASRTVSTSRTETRLRVLVLGRIEAHQKGLDILMNHLAAHPELSSRICVTFVGSGPYEPQIRARLSRDAALAGWVSLRAWSPAIEALESCDVLLMTSRYEGVPLVMLEAMALGVPVVAPDLAGTRAFVQRSELFPMRDMPAAFRILDRMSDADVRRAASERNRATFAAHASNAAFGTAVRALTRELQRLTSASLRQRSA